MRQIVLDTETTGTSVEDGDRIIEIAGLELKSRQRTGNNYQVYINPERDSHKDALAIHGLTTEFLSDKPKFAEIAEEFCNYIRGAELIIHNAPFDVGFLNSELAKLNLPPVEKLATKVIDTLAMARDFFPGRRNSLDALCERYEINNSHRTLHGALIDVDLLADVYLAMTRGQNDLNISLFADPDELLKQSIKTASLNLVVRKATPEEEALHEAYLDEMGKKLDKPVVWRREISTSDSEEKTS